MVFFYLLFKQDTSKQRTIRIQALKNANSKLNNPALENSFRDSNTLDQKQSKAQQFNHWHPEEVGTNENLPCHKAVWAALLSDATAHSFTRTVTTTGSALALVFTRGSSST